MFISLYHCIRFYSFYLPMTSNSTRDSAQLWHHRHERANVSYVGGHRPRLGGVLNFKKIDHSRQQHQAQFISSINCTWWQTLPNLLDDYINSMDDSHSAIWTTGRHIYSMFRLHVCLCLCLRVMRYCVDFTVHHNDYRYNELMKIALFRISLTIFIINVSSSFLLMLMLACDAILCWFYCASQWLSLQWCESELMKIALFV